MGGELILRDGEPAGQVTSAAWGESLGACVALGYVQGVAASADYVKSGTYQLSIGGVLADASVHLRPPYDPAGERSSRNRCGSSFVVPAFGLRSKQAAVPDSGEVAAPAFQPAET